VKKIEITDKKELVQKILGFLVTGEYSHGEYLTLKKLPGPVTINIDHSADQSNIIITFLEKQPIVQLNLDYLPDPTGKLQKLIINEGYLQVIVDGLPDVRIPIVS
jgi:hypothetical protein